MAVEAKRGCGYRKIGGLYLVGGEIGVPCDRLPLALDVCPCCGQGIKQALGFTWVDVAKLVQGVHLVDSKTLFNKTATGAEKVPCDCGMYAPKIPCAFCHAPQTMGKAGLMWVGEKFYKTPADFVKEGMAMGFSKRIKAVPRGFKVGETYVLLAHPKAVPADIVQGRDNERPGVFYIWLPQRIEKILPESARGSQEAQELEERGITAVFVPDNDKDHQGRVYDKQEEPELD